MKALYLKERKQPVVYADFDDPQAKEGEVIVEVKAAALNHRDVYITQDLYPGITTPMILGSDGVGTLDGKEVILNPGEGWKDNPAYAPLNYTILGLPKFGTFAEKIAINADRVHEKPAHLSWQEAAALPLAGVTAYRALFTRGQINANKKVLITGIGGGVALTALQLAVAVGSEVWVTSGSNEKIEKAMALGAKGGANYKEDNWHKDLAGRAGVFDLVIDSAGGDGFAQLLKVCNFGANIVTYGGTRGKVNGLSPQIIFWKQLNIMGSTMGNDQEFADLLAFVAEKKVKPVIDAVFSLEEGAKAFERMDQGLQFGKIVLDVNI
ncbi:MAG: zinc-binding dehydrogenase [Saprospiraceae bacterium]|nr:zinc-binding dehydrogenase [Saprospiraceae bacterium]